MGIFICLFFPSFIYPYFAFGESPMWNYMGQ